MGGMGVAGGFSGGPMGGMGGMGGGQPMNEIEGLFANGFLRSCSGFMQLAMGPQGKDLVPYVPRLLNVVTSGELGAVPGMDCQVFQILRYVAQVTGGCGIEMPKSFSPVNL